MDGYSPNGSDEKTSSTTQKVKVTIENEGCIYRVSVCSKEQATAVTASDRLSALGALMVARPDIFGIEIEEVVSRNLPPTAV